MTMEDRLIVDVADMQTIRFACTKCGAAVTIHVSEFKQLQKDCPGCGRQWAPEGGPAAEAMRRLVHTLRELAATAKDGEFRVGFDLIAPK